MSDETLESRVVAKKETKSGILDFLVSAYSSSKAVKLGLADATAGYSYSLAAVMSGLFYLGVKTIYTSIKNAAKLIMHPLKYLSLSGIKELASETKEHYNPFGKYKRPTFMGATLSVVTDITGF